MTDKTDKDFEAFYLDQYGIDLNRGEPEMKKWNYSDSLVVDRFKVWQAAQDAILKRLPKDDEIMRHFIVKIF